MSVLTITNKNYEEEVSKSKVPVLLDFWAPWCGPCKMLSPIIDEIAEEQQGKIKVGKINIDDEQQLALKFNVMSIPTLVVMHEGKVINTSVGVVSKQQIIDMLK
ncbi:MAG: thioredoxin [Clostridia bacterium]|jgi:thioredoxin 1|nr:thioredoxin [Clostridia bacterium]